jgi:hypothetical protein
VWRSDEVKHGRSRPTGARYCINPVLFLQWHNGDLNDAISDRFEAALKHDVDRPGRPCRAQERNSRQQHITTLPDIVVFSDDESVIEYARKQVNGQGVEVWDGTRRRDQGPVVRSARRALKRLPSTGARKLWPGHTIRDGGR